MERFMIENNNYKKLFEKTSVFIKSSDDDIDNLFNDKNKFNLIYREKIIFVVENNTFSVLL